MHATGLPRCSTTHDWTRLEGIDPLQARRQRREAITVAQAFDRYFGEHFPLRLAIGKMSASTVENYRLWTKPIYMAMGKLKVAEVEQNDIERDSDLVRAIRAMGNRGQEYQPRQYMPNCPLAAGRLRPVSRVGCKRGPGAFPNSPDTIDFRPDPSGHRSAGRDSKVRHYQTGLSSTCRRTCRRPRRAGKRQGQLPRHGCQLEGPSCT